MVAVLYADRRGPYPGLGVDWWDEARDARLYQGAAPVVAHPPCGPWGPWGRMRGLCTLQERDLAPHAVGVLRRVGGVLEHPAGSLLWRELRLPLPGQPEREGLRTIEVDQCRWGHPARKRTWLLLAHVGEVPPIPAWREPTHVIDSSSQRKAAGTSYAHLPKSQRHLTPLLFARWLLAVARTARPGVRYEEVCPHDEGRQPYSLTDYEGGVAHALLCPLCAALAEGDPDGQTASVEALEVAR